MQESDKDYSSSWFDAPFPADASRAETFIKDENKGPEARKKQLIIALNSDDTIVGRLTMWVNGRIADIWFQMDPVRDDNDTLQAEVLGLVIPWLVDEASLLCVTFSVPADESETIAAAESLGMVPSVRLREQIARPGYRVDEIFYQALGTAWSFPEEVTGE